MKMSKHRRRAIQKLGCGGRHTHTTNGADFDCDHQYTWTCDECPCNDHTRHGNHIKPAQETPK